MSRLPRLTALALASVFGLLGRAWSQAQTPCPAWTIEGEQADANLGLVAAAGDVNGDCYDDVLVGAPGYDNGESNEGRASLYLGSASGLSTTVAWAFESDQLGAGLGSVSTAGDVNGDGFDDVIVGAAGFDNGESSEGRAFVHLGSASGLSSTAAWTAESDQAFAAQSVFFPNPPLPVSTAGDVNGDGYDDVLVGASDPAAYVYLGSASGLSTSPAWNGAVEGYSTTWTAVSAAGDVNGDGYDDVLVGAPDCCNALEDEDTEGRVDLYLGSATGLPFSPAWTRTGGDCVLFCASHHLGSSVAGAGDVNGDGLDDVIVGASGIQSAYAYLGAPTGLSGAAWTVDVGSWVSAAGDVNGDGYADVLVGSTIFANGQSNEGLVAAYLGPGLGGSSAIFSGDGINADAIAPRNTIIGTSWNAPLTIGHPHGSSGPLSLMVRSTTTNGPNFSSPMGGRLTEFLVGGPFLTTIPGSHDGSSGNVPNQVIPNLVSFIGVPWAAQYVVVGGGFGDLSRAVFGIVTTCP